MPRKNQPVPVAAEQIERQIYVVRGQRVMVDSDLAELYEVPTKVLNQAVKRNADRSLTILRFGLRCKNLET